MGDHSWLAIVKRQRVACSPTNFMNLIDTKKNYTT
jgi:hypothetical protein